MDNLVVRKLSLLPSLKIIFLLLVTIAKARKLLGKDYEHRTDEEVDALIKKMGTFADVLVDAVIAHLDEEKDNEKRTDTNQSFVTQASR